MCTSLLTAITFYYDIQSTAWCVCLAFVDGVLYKFRQQLVNVALKFFFSAAKMIHTTVQASITHDVSGCVN